MVFWRWLHEDWTRGADVPGRSSLAPLLPAGGVKKVENGRYSALLSFRKAVFWRWPRDHWSRDADVPGRTSLGPVLPAGGVRKVENGR